MFLEHVEMVTSNLEQTFAHIQGLEFDAHPIFVPINYIIIQMYNKIENENMKNFIFKVFYISSSSEHLLMLCTFLAINIRGGDYHNTSAMNIQMYKTIIITKTPLEYLSLVPLSRLCASFPPNLEC